MIPPLPKVTYENAAIILEGETVLQQELLNIMAKSKNPLGVHQLQYFKRVDASMSIEDAQGPTLACKSGCSFCCHFRVEVFATEALTIAEHIKKNPAETKKIVAKLQENIALHAIAPPGKQMHKNIACAFLSPDKTCSIYEVRPLGCRSYHSLDVAVCETSFNQDALPQDMPENRARVIMANVFIRSNIKAQQRDGFDSTLYELSTAVLAALLEPASAKRWRNKKKAFVNKL